MTSQTILQIQLQFLDLVHSIHRHRISSNKFKYRSNYIVHFIDFGYSIWCRYQLPCATWQIHKGYFRIKSSMCNTMSTNGLPPVYIRLGFRTRELYKLQRAGTESQAKACAKWWEFRIGHTSHGLIVDDCSMSWVVHPPTNSQHSIVEGVECKRM